MVEFQRLPEPNYSQSLPRGGLCTQVGEELKMKIAVTKIRAFAHKEIVYLFEIPFPAFLIWCQTSLSFTSDLYHFLCLTIIITILEELREMTGLKALEDSPFCCWLQMDKAGPIIALLCNFPLGSTLLLFLKVAFLSR